MKYQITHKTWYAYADLVPICHNLVHLAPRDTPYQKCIDYRLEDRSGSRISHHRDDYFGNRTEYFSIEGAHRKLEIIAESTVEVAPTRRTRSAASRPPGKTCVTEAHESRQRNGRAPRIVRPDSLATHAFRRRACPLIAELREYAAPSFPPRRPIVEAIADLARPDSRRLPVRLPGDDRRHAAGRRAPPAPRRLPGLRPPGRRLPPRDGPGGALHERLPPHHAAAGQSRGWSVPTRRTPGARAGAARWAGSTSIPPTIASRAIRMLRSPGAATTATCARSKASSSAAANTASA